MQYQPCSLCFPLTTHSDTRRAMWGGKARLGVIVRHWSIHKEVKSKRRAQKVPTPMLVAFVKTCIRTQETLRIQSDAKQRFYIYP